ncbi:MAG: hypothetical protein U1E76_15585 [Planctomycetota bacterium]
MEVALARVPAGSILIALARAAAGDRAGRTPCAADPRRRYARRPDPLAGARPLRDLDPGNRPFLGGRYQLGDSTLYVSRGVGTSVILLRFRARPDHHDHPASRRGVTRVDAVKPAARIFVFAALLRALRDDAHHRPEEPS